MSTTSVQFAVLLLSFYSDTIVVTDSNP